MAVTENIAEAPGALGVEVRLIGMEGIKKKLAELDVKLRRQIVRKALRRGGALMDRMMTQAAPRRLKPYTGRRATVRKPGDLARSIRAFISIRDHGFESSVRIGPSGRFNPGIGSMLEFGTEERFTKGRRGKAVAYRGRVLPRAWMSRTYRIYKNTALAVIEQSLQQDLFRD